MSSILPLPPPIAYGLPWRMVFPTKRAPVLLERFAYPDFIESLTPEELKYSEEVLTALLGKMLAAHKAPYTLVRAHVNQATSEILFAQRSPPGLKVSLGATRYKLREALVWVGTSVNRLVKALRPDPGIQQPEYSHQFTDADWVNIGYEDRPPAAPRGPKPGSPAVRRPPKLILTPPHGKLERRKRQDDTLRLRSKSGETITGGDHRLGWLLFEAHKVVSLNRPEPLGAEEVLGKLSRSIIPGAAELGKLLEAQLDAVEKTSITEEIRWVLRDLLEHAPAQHEWTHKSLLWAFGVSEDGKFDPHFWSASLPPAAYRLRRKLVPIVAPFRALTFHSPALAEMADQLTSLGFMGARHLQSRLGPFIGESNVIGVARFMTDVVHVTPGRMDNVPLAIDGHNTDLFFWNQDISPAAILDVCGLAWNLTVAKGAFSFEEIVDTFREKFEGARREVLVREILNEWGAVRWLDKPGYGVVLDAASTIVDVVEQMLAVAWPHAVPISDISEALRTLRLPPRKIAAARARIGQPDTEFVADNVLLQALLVSGKARLVGNASLALKHRPPEDYWDFRPVERDLIDYLHLVGGTAPNRSIYQHFKTDKSVERDALSEAMKAYPYLHAPHPHWTALRPWAVQER